MTQDVSAGDPSPRENMIRSALWNLIGPACALLSAPILARALGAEGRGELATAIAPLVLFVGLAGLGIPEAATNVIARVPNLSRRVAAHSLWLLTVAGVVGTLVIVLLAPILSGGDSDLTLLVAAASAALTPALIVGLFRGTAAGFHSWRLVNAEKISSALVRLVLFAVLAWFGLLTVPVAILVMALVPVFSGIPYLWLRKRFQTSQPQDDQLKPDDSPNVVPVILGYGSRAWLGSLSGMLLSRVDQLLITPLAGALQLGLYAVAVSISELALLTNNAIRDVLTAADAAESDDRRVFVSSRISFLVSAVVGVLISIAAVPLVPILFGESFADAVPIVWLLVGAIVVGVPGSVAGAALSARGRPGARSISLSIAAGTNIVLVLLLTPGFGAVGAALATLVGNLISANLNIFFTRKHFGFRAREFYGVRKEDIRILLRAVLRR